MLKFVIGIFLILTLVYANNEISAYEENGHYFTIRTILGLGLKTGFFSKEESNIISFCSQLPDEVPELDAIKVYRKFAFEYPFNFAIWVITDKGSHDKLGRMAEIQQLLHGLTGGDSNTLFSVAKSINLKLISEVQKQNPRSLETLCALGFSFHLFGDSFAHRKLRNKNLMYPTGRGHASDLTIPDQVTYNLKSSKRWQDYINELSKILKTNQRVDDLQDALIQIENLSNQTFPVDCIFGDECNSILRSILLKRLTSEDFLPDYNPINNSIYDSKSCQNYVDSVFQKNEWKGKLDCEASWKIYKKTSLLTWKQVGKFNDKNSRKQIYLYEGEDLWKSY